MPDQNTTPDINKLQQQMGALADKAPKEDYPPRAKGQDDIIAGMKNSEKLTSFERGVYKALPGFSQSTVGKALQKFGESWAGKALSYLDIGAEGVERTVGLASQLLNAKPGEANFNLADAWYAGSLFADTTNLPTLKKDANGKVIGLSIPDALPGAEGLADARNKIADLVAGGMDRGEALVKVREEYYNGLGALALRSQLYDTYFHIAADPLNYIMPALKPVEVLQARRAVALSEKVAYTADELLTKVDDINKLAEAAKVAGKAEDVAAYTKEAAKLTELAGKVSSGEVKTINRMDKFAIMMTGGDLFNPNQTIEKLAKIPILGAPIKAFQLTPKSKALELLNVMRDNIGAKIVASLFDDPNAEMEMMNAVRRASAGSTGVEFGHAFLTMEGRTAQGFLSGAEAAIAPLADYFSESVVKRRGLLQSISEATGYTLEGVIKNAKENPEAFMKVLAGKISPNTPALAQAMQTGELSTEALGVLAKTFENAPYDKTTFTVHLLDKIEEQAAKQAIIQFGVTQDSLPVRWSNALKSMESLAFMRMNPGYMMRNMINNEVTGIARGVSGIWTTAEMDKFIDDLGFVPKRLGEVVAGTESEAMSAGEIAVAAATHSEGTPEKIAELAKKIKLGKANEFDVTTYSRITEQSARKRFSVAGMQQFFHDFWKPPKLENAIDNIDDLEKASPGISNLIDNAVKTSYGNKQKVIDALGGNLNLNSQSVLDSVSEALGYRAEEALGDELVAHIHANLPEAIKKGTVDKFLFETRAKLESHLEEEFTQKIQDIVDNVAAQTEGGGQQMFYHKVGEAQDIFWGSHSEATMRSMTVWDAYHEAVDAKDWDRASAVAARNMADDELHYSRAFRRVDAYLEGLEKGAQKAGIAFPKEVRQGFRDFQKNWKEFFDFRKQGYEELRGMKYNDPQRIARYDKLQAELKIKYQKAVEFEDAIQQHADDAVGSLIKDPQQKQIFTNYRDGMAQMRKTWKDSVNAVREELESTPVNERAAVWQKHKMEVKKQLDAMHQTDRAGIAAMQGDPKAAELFQAPVPPQPEGAQFNIYQMANEYGIPSATEAGARNDKRILATVNKYVGAGAEPQVTGAKALEQAVQVPRSELPAAVSERIGNEAKRLLSELSGGGVEKSSVGGRIGTTNVGWYKELNAGKGLQKPEIEKALQKIIEDHGKDKGVNVERLKNMIMDNVTHGDPASGTPPDLYALQELGAPKKTMEKALADYNDITKQELTLQDAIDASTPSEALLRNKNQPYYNDQGKLVMPKKFTRVQDIPEDIARQAFDARAAEKGTQVPQKAANVSEQFIADVKKVIPDLPPYDLGKDQMAYGRQMTALDEIVNAAKKQADKTPAMLQDLAPELRDQVMKYIDNLDSEFSSARLAASKYGTMRADSALLNYSRRTNFDTAVGVIFPYAFWTTTSMMKWAVESIDRPAMLTSYLRIKKFMETAGTPQSGFPSRFRDQIRIKLPFTPDWMGDTFIDPMKLALPFDAFAQPIEQYQKTQQTVDGRAQRLLETQLQDGRITQKEYETAINTKSGSVWEMAKSETENNDASLKTDVWDFANLVSSPHAPIQWAYNLARGHPEDIGPFTPMSRSLKNVATTLGVKDWNNSPYNVEAKFRKQLGLPAFDKYEDYRVAREISNFAGTGDYSLDDIKEAMAIEASVEAGKITHDDAMKNEIYAKAVERGNQEYSGGKMGAALQLIGINVHAYPEGEQNLRALSVEFGDAYKKYKDANDTMQAWMDKHPDLSQEDATAQFESQFPQVAKDADALTNFFDKHPEYETRLGLFDPPEERLKKFMVDSVWAQWNSLPKITKNELQDQLGQNFNDAFLNKDTRSYDALSSEELSMYLKLMGGKPIGTMTADQKMITDMFSGTLKITKPEIAWRAQTFYDTRDKRYPDFFKQQDEYYKLNKNQRGAYLKEHPELKDYWKFRSDFMIKNPDLVQYLTDDPKAIEKAKKTQRNPEVAVPTAQEIKANVSPSLGGLLTDYFQGGEDLPYEANHALDLMADQYGLTRQQLLNILGQQMGQP